MQLETALGLERLQLLPNLASPVGLTLVLLPRELKHLLNLVKRLALKPVEQVSERVKLLQARFEDLRRIADEGAHRSERLARSAVLAVLERREENRTEGVRPCPLARRDALVRQEHGLERLDKRVDLVAEDGAVVPQREDERLVFVAFDVVAGQDARDPVLRTADLGGQGEKRRVETAEG